ncbi:MAG: hypothetical protein ACRYG4_01840 [Janthinobacterium lividum]
MNFPRFYPRRLGPTGAAFRHLFEHHLAPALFACDTPDPDVRVQDGEALVWIPECRLVVTSILLAHPTNDLERSRLAKMFECDVLVLDLSRPGGMVDCEVDLFAPQSTPKRTIGCLALWLSPENVPALVPDRPRSVDTDRCSLGLTPDGLQMIADPFESDGRWRRGIDRAIDAANAAHAVQAGSAQTPKSKVVSDLVRRMSQQVTPR